MEFEYTSSIYVENEDIDEMVNLVNGKDVTFEDFLFPEQQTINQLNNYNNE